MSKLRAPLIICWRVPRRCGLSGTTLTIHLRWSEIAQINQLLRDAIQPWRYGAELTLIGISEAGLIARPSWCLRMCAIASCAQALPGEGAFAIPAYPSMCIVCL